MKILFYNHTGKVSGAERIILLILRRLNRRRFSPVMVCPANDNLVEAVSELGVPCQTIEPLEARFTARPDKLLRYIYSFFKIIRQLRARITEASPDLIHANSIRAGLVATGASFGTKIPVIWHLQDELPPHPLSTLIRLFAAASSRLRLMPASKATGDSFRGKLWHFLNHRPLETVVHNAIELDEFKPDSSHHERIRKELNLSDEEFVLGIVGQITPRKGQLELLRVFAHRQKELPPATLLIVGSPMFNQDYLYFEELKQTAESLGISNRVRFLGQRSDVAAIMQALDVLVINSKSEALVVVALEAMACKTPVIATEVGGTGEIIQHKSNGWLVPFGDESALAEAVTVLSRDSKMRESFAEAGFQYAKKHLSAERLIKQVEEFYVLCREHNQEREVEKPLTGMRRKANV